MKKGGKMVAEHSLSSRSKVRNSGNFCKDFLYIIILYNEVQSSLQSAFKMVRLKMPGTQDLYGNLNSELFRYC